MGEMIIKITEMLKEMLGEKYTVQTKEVTKNNGVILHGILISERGSAVVPVIYVDEMLEMVKSRQETIQGVAGKIMNLYKNLGNESEVRSVVSALSREDILKKVVCKVVNKHENEKYLTTVPHKEFLDLAVLYCAVLMNDALGNYYLTITHELCERYGIRIEELDAAAMDNTKADGFEINTIESIIARITGIPEKEMAMQTPRMYVLSNRINKYGASVILYPEYLKKLSLLLKDDLFILPSSIHELLVVPAACTEPDTLRDIVKAVNAEEVDAEEMLSENVYKYSQKKGNLTIA